jgi:tRNA G18 (ribose-2'-O)-methylase SpoU
MYSSRRPPIILCSAGASPATDNDKVSAHTPNRFGKGTASAVPKAMKIDTALAAEGLWLAVESIESPGNLGTIIRTAEAAGVAGIFLHGQSDDPWDPAAVRASMGSLFSQKLVRCSAREFTDWARSSGVAIVGSSPSGLLDYKALRYRRPAVLLIGSEKRGLSGHLIEASDFMVAFPCAAVATRLMSPWPPAFFSFICRIVKCPANSEGREGGDR